MGFGQCRSSGKILTDRLRRRSAPKAKILLSGGIQSFWRVAKEPWQRILTSIRLRFWLGGVPIRLGERLVRRLETGG